MMQAQFKPWTVVFTCIAVMSIVAAHSLGRASSESSRKQELEKQQALTTDMSEKLLEASGRLRQGMLILTTNHDYAKDKEIKEESANTSHEGQKALARGYGIEFMLLEDIMITGEPFRRTMQSARLKRNEMLLIMKNEKALSSAQKFTMEGHDMLERGEKIIMEPQL